MKRFIFHKKTSPAGLALGNLYNLGLAWVLTQLYVSLRLETVKLQKHDYLANGQNCILFYSKPIDLIYKISF